MKLTIIGTGYVGLVTGACFAEMGSTVTCVDIDQVKIDNLKKGILPIYEPGLENLVIQNYKEGTLNFSTSLEQASEHSNIFFIAVGTPPGEDGSADLQFVLQVAKEIGQNINEYSVIIDKSTVPVGTADKVKSTIQAELSKRGVNIEYDVVSNPEFLKEGAAVNDFLKPDRIIIGVDSKRAAEQMRRLYAPFSRNREKIISMNVRDAEMTKYAANSMLATKISFMNEISNICERLGVDVENVRKGIGSDARIGYSFIYPGCGYGGSCFPKDVKALIKTSKDQGFLPELLNAVEKRNNLQKQVLSDKIIKKFGQDLTGKIFCMWGLSFKPGTDDIRESSSAVILKELIDAGAIIKAFDPVAMNQALKEFPEKWFSKDKLKLEASLYRAIENTDALILVTEWKAFRQPDFKLMADTMRQRIIFDGRNQYDPMEVSEAGFEYHGIGRERVQ
ncbi:MAG: UDP-glucose/GDP-mannose dehydrogenase family protein [Desulfobacula sp.]|jgi:UDPglucose 6-dehydrogenase|uniref:UDP-glucose dehydrogenase family protein n=1 Tax=Desulfobacula sp. TaxID=2593537 RepID=UPI001DE96763|nr:UDP-glucose/GDP-mannose dehydrogenase family protein [Desulfobacula sp.]MBT3485446.1 UDP-glucose/GDP-mannose dehydrogenase family protein [Desulfobacula sp.]MBT3805589.1 UDP-glucose/GDP-mannose dehydrogenase family protein [Desulfobacula sp.]MBT4026085.1 UDP-glucose/GDP-mannose dehydrogenase family protein [Desulfobacula sp.]MBT4199967.1 UDP-glucose/GDP-mannose dehydrogenase family protein [Desulfobacula sp.]